MTGSKNQKARENPVEQADFVHMVRMSEHRKCREQPRLPAQRGRFLPPWLCLGAGCLALGAGLLAGQAAAAAGAFSPGAGAAGAGGGRAVLGQSARAVGSAGCARGVEITALEAPALFEALERIRRKIRAPMIHHVRLNDEFNASIQQVPRYGLLGGSVNHLTIGLPLLMALNRPRFLAVLAHEYGHLRGDHGRFAAWIYRSRLAWMQLHHGLQDDSSPSRWPRRPFALVLPRFSAKTFALARQDEYEADRIAGRLMGVTWLRLR